jgi:hypothetical protein
VIVVALVAVFVVQQTTPPSAPSTNPSASPPPSGGLPGALLYKAQQADGTTRLWRWDLQSGSVEPGPVIRSGTVELVDAYRAQTGWVGLTARDERGETAWILRSLEEDATLERIASGDAVAWSPGGLVVDAASIRHVGEGTECGTFAMRAYLPSLGKGSLRFRQPICGTIQALVRDETVPFIGLVHGGTATVSIIGSSSVAPVVPDHLLVGSSSANDLLVMPSSCLGPGPGPTTSTCPGLALYLGSAPPKPYGRGGRRLLPERVLTWAPGGPSAFVLGTYADTRGIYRVEVGPSRRLPAPELVAPSLAVDVYATVAYDGTLILTRDGMVSTWREGRLEDLPLPDGAPRPDGPLLWVAALRY